MSSTKTYYNSVDALRGITALMVALIHFINHSDGNGSLFSETAEIQKQTEMISGVVFIFFLLSGFVITMSMDRQKYDISRLGHFLGRRWIRIELPYIFSIFIVLFVAYIWCIRNETAFVFQPLQFVHHLTYTVSIFGYEWYSLIYWTLALEFQFYLLIGLLFPFFMSKTKGLKYGSLLLFCLLGIVFPDNRLLFIYAPTFVAGILMYTYFKGESKKIDLFFIIGALLQTVYQFGFFTSICLLIALIVIHFNVSENNIFNKIGRRAYSFYLLHGVIGGSILYFLTPLASGIVYKILILVVAMLGSLVLSSIFFRWIEIPSIQLSKKVRFPPKKPPKTNLK